eukprot:7561689-Alexandrium_andersonii.AAC.1
MLKSLSEWRFSLSEVTLIRLTPLCPTISPRDCAARSSLRSTIPVSSSASKARAASSRRPLFPSSTRAPSPARAQ